MLIFFERVYISGPVFLDLSLRPKEQGQEKRAPGVRGGTLPKNNYVFSIIRAISCFNKHNYRGTTVILW